MKAWFFILLSLLAGVPRMFAADNPADFVAANELYDQGKYAAAAAGYEKILQSGVESPALYFNDANAEFKAGNLGRAIAAFRRAELLAPRDAEIRANLQFVRNQVRGTTVREERWQAWLGQLTLNQWTLLAAAAFWITFLLLAAQQWRPSLTPKLKSPATWLVVMTVLCSLVLALQTMSHFSNQTAVVTGAEITARSGPFDDAQNTFTLHDGAELSVLDRHNQWVQVTDGTGKTGWLNQQQVEILPGA
jgi:tetratricopeptide (TPR) repeat protein